eukprot:3655157-Prorocentrum_lima.AAC.1
MPLETVLRCVINLEQPVMHHEHLPAKGDNCHLVLAHLPLKSIVRQPRGHHVAGSRIEVLFQFLEVGEADG